MHKQKLCELLTSYSQAEDSLWNIQWVIAMKCRNDFICLRVSWFSFRHFFMYSLWH